MYSILFLAMTVPTDVGQCNNATVRYACSTKAACSTAKPAVVVVVPAKAACSTSATCSTARVGPIQRAHKRAAARHDARAVAIGLRQGNLVLAAPEMIPPPKIQKAK
jgi:hypothetical protein